MSSKNLSTKILIIGLMLTMAGSLIFYLGHQTIARYFSQCCRWEIVVGGLSEDAVNELKQAINQLRIGTILGILGVILIIISVTYIWVKRVVKTIRCQMPVKLLFLKKTMLKN